MEDIIEVIFITVKGLTERLGAIVIYLFFLGKKDYNTILLKYKVATFVIGLILYVLLLCFAIPALVSVIT